jgi:hypothetical protein
VLGSKEIMLLNHTGCGFTTFTDAELNAKFSELTGDATPAPMRFFAFRDPEQPAFAMREAMSAFNLKSDILGTHLVANHWGLLRLRQAEEFHETVATAACYIRETR